MNFAADSRLGAVTLEDAPYFAALTMRHTGGGYWGRGSTPAEARSIAFRAARLSGVAKPEECDLIITDTRSGESVPWEVTP